MSPSEFDLRAALHDGEGDGPDPDAMLAAGRARASARRTRIAAVSGTVAGIAALGVAGAVLLTHGGGGQQTADRGPAGPVSARNVPAGAADASAASGNDGTNVNPKAAPTGSSGTSPSGNTAPQGPGGPATPCPFAYPTSGLPALGGGQGDGPLFPKPVTSVLVCGYGMTAGGSDVTPGHVVLTGSDASRLVHSLEDAPTTKAQRVCPDFRVADDHRLAIVGIASDGSGESPLYTTLGQNPCISQVSNGTAIRYSWSPPTDLRTELFAIQPR